jgi:two-component system, NtrC family, sensor histidine kinase KinB
MTSLRHKLWLGFGGLLLILLLVSLLTVIVLTRYSHALERIFQENYNSAVYCDAMKDALDRLNLRQQLLIWNDHSASRIDSAVEQTNFRTNLALQLGNCTLPGELEHTLHLEQIWDEYHAVLGQFDSAGADQKSIYQKSLLPGYQEMKQTAQWIANANISNMVSVDGRIKQTLLDVRTALLVLVTTGTLAAAVVVGAAGRSVLQPLVALTRSAREIAAGNLDHNLPVRSNDEMGQLAQAFNSMASKLQEFRRLDHDRLARTQQTTQLAIDSLPDAVFIIGPGGRVEISNRTARTHFGIEPDSTVEQLGERLKWLLPLYDAVRTSKHAEEEQGYRSAVQLFDAGHERFLLPRALPMFGPDNLLIGVTFILVDVTRLRAADELKSGLVSTVSHELRTPLTSIRMALSLLGGGKFGALAPKQNTLLTAAREDSDRLYRIVENLLSMSRMESGQAEFQQRPVAPAEIVAQTVGPMRSAFVEKGIDLQVEVPAQLPEVLADSTAVGSALTNLLTNALKFTPAGGQVDVRVEPDGEFVAFIVRDTGPGIPDQYVHRIFDKFFRVPSKDGPGGAGLGLAIAQEVIVAHGGRIELCPGNGVGSTFRFTLRQSGNGPLG